MRRHFVPSPAGAKSRRGMKSAEFHWPSRMSIPAAFSAGGGGCEHGASIGARFASRAAGPRRVSAATSARIIHFVVLL